MSNLKFRLENSHSLICILDESSGFYPKQMNLDKSQFFVVHYIDYHNPWGLQYIMRNKRFIELSKFKSIRQSHLYVMDNYYRCLGFSFQGQPLCNDPDDVQLDFLVGCISA